MEKKLVLLYSDDFLFFRWIRQYLLTKKFDVRFFDKPNSFIQTTLQSPENIKLMLLEQIMFSPGNSFNGRRKKTYQSCALFLLDQIYSSIHNSDDLKKIENIPKCILSDWTYFDDDSFNQIKSDARIKDFLTKSDYREKLNLIL